ncbi:MAG TPA: N-formylglutamate amidohydrolase [Ramlibacter sp.]|nr:N-formylglutamate amidohydrolase [Ramlibacter sp.]
MLPGSPLHLATLQLGSGPLVFESPHSGSAYPPDFGFCCPLDELRGAEDTHVETLWGFAADLGHSLLCARFPRTYIDVNRGLGEGRDPAGAAGRHAQLGMGLFWTRTLRGSEIYMHPPRPEELGRRIERCWRPYHALLSHAIAQAHAAHGWSMHVSCHSMPSDARLYARECPGWTPTDFVVGDGEGRHADPAIAQAVAQFLRGEGWTADVNHPFRGAELLRQHGDPQRHRHSIQIEVRKDLYMDEATLLPHDGAAVLARSLRGVVRMLASWR